MIATMAPYEEMIRRLESVTARLQRLEAQPPSMLPIWDACARYGIHPDATAARNATQLQQAIDDCYAAGGGRIWLPSHASTKKIQFSSGITIKDKVIMMGGAANPSDGGIGATSLVYTGSGTAIAFSDGCMGGAMRDLSLYKDAGNANTGVTGIDVVGTHRCGLRSVSIADFDEANDISMKVRGATNSAIDNVFEQVFIRNGKTALKMNGGGGQVANLNTFVGCQFIGHATVAVLLNDQYCNENTFIGCDMSGVVGGAAVATAVQIKGSRDAVFINPYFENATAGWDLQSGTVNFVVIGGYYTLNVTTVWQIAAGVTYFRMADQNGHLVATNSDINMAGGFKTPFLFAVSGVTPNSSGSMYFPGDTNLTSYRPPFSGSVLALTLERYSGSDPTTGSMTAWPVISGSSALPVVTANSTWGGWASVTQAKDSTAASFNANQYLQVKYQTSSGWDSTGEYVATLTVEM